MLLVKAVSLVLRTNCPSLEARTDGSQDCTTVSPNRRKPGQGRESYIQSSMGGTTASCLGGTSIQEHIYGSHRDGVIPPASLPTATLFPDQARKLPEYYQSKNNLHSFLIKQQKKKLGLGMLLTKQKPCYKTLSDKLGGAGSNLK